MDSGTAGGDPEINSASSFSGFRLNSSFSLVHSRLPALCKLLLLLLCALLLSLLSRLLVLLLIGCVVVDRWFQGTNRLGTHLDPNSSNRYQHGLFFLPSHQQQQLTQVMAILESEKRPRGLRVPSLSSIKANGLSFGKKGSEASQQQQQQQQQQKMDSLPEALPPPPPDKRLPSLPSSMPPRAAPAPAPTPVAAPTPVRVPAASVSDFSFDAAPMSDFGTDRYPMPMPSGLAPNRSSNNVNNTNNGDGISHSNHGSLAVPSPPVQRTPSNGSQGTGTSDGEPLEDFIPEPEPEAVDRVYSNSVSPALEPVPDEAPVNMDDVWTPPDYEPVAAPLNKLHFACYQEHRSMPVAANIWHAVPCMTCHKFDREVRHRCVFCCLRICESCYQNLQKCPGRSLDELLAMIQA